MKKEKTIIKDKSSHKPKKKTSIFLWLLVAIIVLLVFFGYRFFSFQKQMEDRRETMMEQRQVMIDHWKEQGLSDEEINEKLESTRQEQVKNSGRRPPLMGIFRIFRGGQRSSR